MKRLSGIGGNQVGSLIESGGAPGLGLLRARKFNFEFHLHGQLVDLSFDLLLQLAGKLLPPFRYRVPQPQIFLSSRTDLLAKLLNQLIAIFDLAEFAAHLSPKSEHLLQRLPVFALEPLNKREAVFDLRQALGRSVDALSVIAQR